MKKPDPEVDGRRTDKLFAELLQRARIWVPNWQLQGDDAKDQDPDFGRALLQIAARLSSEVTERLDRTPAKMALGLLDWLGITRRAGHAARMPVVFKMAEGAANPVQAPKRTRLQANAGETPISFETVDDVQLVPSPISQMVGVDPDKDAIYFPPSDVLSLEPPTLGPTEWTAKSLASAKDFTLQLTPPLGLKKDMLLEVAKLEYRVSADPQGDLVTVEPAIGTANPGSQLADAGTDSAIVTGAAVKKVGEFIPFGGVSRNLQEHALYIGDDDALNLSSPACIALQGAGGFPSDLRWEYWGKHGEAQNPGWNELKQKAEGNQLFLKFPGGDFAAAMDNSSEDPKGSVEVKEIRSGLSSRWIRATRASGSQSAVSFEQLTLKINCDDCLAAGGGTKSKMPKPKMDGVANTTALVLNGGFYPLGKIPRQFDAFYLGCPEVFSKPGAKATINFDVANSTLGRLTIAATSPTTFRVFGVSKDGALHRYNLALTSSATVTYLGASRPSPVSGMVAAANANTLALSPGVAPVLVSSAVAISVIVASEEQVWRWEEPNTVFPGSGIWYSLGSVGDSSRPKPIVNLVNLGFRSDAIQPDSLLVALTDNKLYLARYRAGTLPEWAAPNVTGKWANIAPIRDAASHDGTLAEAFVGIDTDGAIYRINQDQTGRNWVPEKITAETVPWNASVAPLAKKDEDGNVLVIGLAKLETPTLRALAFDVSGSTTVAPRGVELPSRTRLVRGADTIAFDFWIDDAATLHVVFGIESPSEDQHRLAWWEPLEPSSTVAIGDPVPGIGNLKAGPTLVGQQAVVPGASLDLMITELSPKKVTVSSDSLKEGILCGDNLNPRDVLELSLSRTRTEYVSVGSLVNLQSLQNGGQATNLYLSDSPVDEDYRRLTRGRIFPWDSTHYQATIQDDLHLLLKLAPGDPFPSHLIRGSVLLLLDASDRAFGTLLVQQVDRATKVIQIRPRLRGPILTSSSLTFRLYQPGSVRRKQIKVRPVLLLNPATAAEADVITGLQLIKALYFESRGADPRRQSLSYRLADIGSGHLKTAVLDSTWRSLPIPDATTGLLGLWVELAQNTWFRFPGDTSRNPELSWEYWNGTGWWKIEISEDSTANLKKGGDIIFEIPADLMPTEVLGKTSHWIRARLIGGDYGKESFITHTDKETVSTSPLREKLTQSVVVNTDDIHAPFVLDVGISYSICTPLIPKFLLTLDSGSWLDQSDANRTPGATVEAFIPIAERLGRMTGPPVGNATQGTSADVACGCGSSTQGPIPATAPCTVEGAMMSEPAGTGTELRIIAKVPAAGASEVVANTPIQAVFSVPMDPATLRDQGFELRDANDQLVPGTVEYVDATRTARYKPLTALAPSASYRVTIRGGSEAPHVKALNGKPLVSDVNWTFSTAATSTRSIYLAFDKPLSGGPIRILFLLKDLDHDSAAPLVVETLRNNRFEPVVVQDGTRALGETGLVTLILDGPPSQAELFGKTGYWLRLRPATAASAAAWSPVIRGAYVNAVQAEATESQVLEILGSSDGSPSQAFTLLRPPVLQDSLELRVLEPLGDEEKAVLSKTPGKVLENVPGLAAGRWVLWQEVVDPGDEGPDDRVYALDPVSGEIRFGDGMHGMIPPIGTDAIVAFTYRRGGEAAANKVQPFVPINIVTPIAGAESVITPDNVAGGSDAEDAESVLRFAAPRLRHRDRAVTLRDLEDLALDFSPEIVQARAFNDRNGLRLAVVIGARGNPATVVRPASPDPSRAQARVLRDYLLAHASPVLARQGSLNVVAAVRVSFRVELGLSVASVDVTGRVGSAVKTAVKGLFDPSMGGWDGLGWRIGVAPTEDDVAARLLAIEGLDSIETVIFSRDDGKVMASSRTLAIGPDQLAWLVPDGIKLHFTARRVMS